MRVQCEECDGTGKVGRSRDIVAGDRHCEYCHGHGLREAELLDYDGATVTVRSTGFCGTCNIFGDRTIIVINAADEEIQVASIEEIDCG